MEFNRSLPTGSSAYAQVLAEFNEAPLLQVTSADEADGGIQHKPSEHHNHHHHVHKDEKLVHGLHHCYTIEGGHIHAKYGCNHIHQPVDSSPSLARRRSISNAAPVTLGPNGTVHHLFPEDGPHRTRSHSDAAGKRRASSFTGHSNPISPARSGSGNLDTMPEESSLVDPSQKRRGSNVVLHSGELHFVYDQLKGK